MAQIRVRHPNGISTIQVGLDDNFTVQDFQQEILAATEILPSIQDRNYPASLFL
jgi:hypothetical protein